MIIVRHVYGMALAMLCVLCASVGFLAVSTLLSLVGGQ